MIRRGIQRLHRNDRGAVSVLLLLTVLALVVLIMMVWNTGEYATRREHAQTAADATAHSTATWLARTTNLVAAQNMLICQDGSAEVIWRAVMHMPNWRREAHAPVTWATITPADADAASLTFAQSVRANLEAQQKVANDMLAGKDAGLNNAQTAVANALNGVAVQYNLTQASYATIKGLKGSNLFDTPQEAKAFDDALRQAGVVMFWVNNTYMNGGAPQNPLTQPFPGGSEGFGPGNNGASLTRVAQIAAGQVADIPWVLDIVQNHVLPALTDELTVVTEFEARVAPAMGEAVAAQMLAKEAEVFTNEMATMSQLPGVLQSQVTQMQGAYNCQMTFGSLRPDPDNPGQAGPVKAPIMPAEQAPAVANYEDQIRQAAITIDAMNVHTITPAGDARIWHPGVDAAVPGNYLAQYPFLRPTHFVDGWEGGARLGWGHVYAAPIEKYFSERVWKDAAGLGNDIGRIDTRRNQLLQEINAIIQVLFTAKPIPATIGDTQKNAQGGYDQIAVPVNIPFASKKPAAVAVAAQVFAFNMQLAAYVNSVRALQFQITQLGFLFNQFTDPFARDRWNHDVDYWRCYKLRILGEQKQFMVLEPYRLRNIPDWAMGGMLANVTSNAEAVIIARHLNGLTRAISYEFADADPNGVKGTIPNRQQRANFYAAMPQFGVAQIALAVATDAATRMGPEIGAEWVRRPWPYEITPPADPVTAPPGMTKPDRQMYFTFLTSALTQGDTSPRTLMPKLFGPSRPMLAFAQGECFNWMEFNVNYGGTDHYDEVNFINTNNPGANPNAPWWGDSTATFRASPRCWRLCSPGGWSWQPRLAYSDALYQALQMNVPLANTFDQVGVRINDADTADKITLH